jgi:hypothetical protein
MLALLGLLALVCAVVAAVFLVLMQYGPVKTQDTHMNLALTFAAATAVFWFVGFVDGNGHSGTLLIILAAIVFGTWLGVTLIKPRHDHTLNKKS